MTYSIVAGGSIPINGKDRGHNRSSGGLLRYCCREDAILILPDEAGTVVIDIYQLNLQAYIWALPGVQV